jgi:hypothetical protein
MNLSKLLIAAAVSVAASPAAAAPTPGQWTIDVSTMATGAHFNTIGICIKADGTWSSTAQRRGSGRWLMSGSSTVLWRGNYDTGLNDAAVLTAISPTAMSGPLMQWVAGTADQTNTAMENIFGHSVWRFKSAVCDRSL